MTFVKRLEKKFQNFIKYKPKTIAGLIAVSGPTGSGKTSVARYLAKRLNLSCCSSEEIIENYYYDNGIILTGLPTLACNDHYEQICHKIWQTAISGNVIIEGNDCNFILGELAQYRIFISCPHTLRVERVSSNNNKNRILTHLELKVLDCRELIWNLCVCGVDLLDHSLHTNYIQNTGTIKNLYTEIDKIIIQMHNSANHIGVPGVEIIKTT